MVRLNVVLPAFVGWMIENLLLFLALVILRHENQIEAEPNPISILLISTLLEKL
jgi:hypothetical protein